MNRTKFALALVAVAAAGFVGALRLMRHVDDVVRALREQQPSPQGQPLNSAFLAELTKHPEFLLAGQAGVPLDMPETRRQVAEALHEATPEETAALQRILAPDNIEEALRSGAYSAADIAGGGESATPPSFPGKPEDEPPHKQYIGTYGPTEPQG